MSAGIDRVVDQVAALTGVPAHQIFSEQRTRPIADARAIAYYAARESTLWSFSRLGRAFGKDRTSVIHGCRQAAVRLSRDPALAAQVAALIRRTRADTGIPGPQDIDVIDLAAPMAAGCRRAAIGASTREVMCLGRAVMELWDIALAAEVFVQRVATARTDDDSNEARFVRALGTAITEEIDALRAPPETTNPHTSKEDAA